MEEVFITAIVFAGIYMIIKVFTDFLLKKRLINAGHVDKAEILEPMKDKEINSYPTLKWGLVSLFAGAGLLVIGVMGRNGSMDWNHYQGGYMSFGIELIAIALGFLLYFVIAKNRKN